MKKYSQLSINEKINLKGNWQKKGIAYGTIPFNWSAMTAPAVWMDTLLNCAFDGLYKWGRKLKGGYCPL